MPRSILMMVTLLALGAGGCPGGGGSNAISDAGSGGSDGSGGTANGGGGGANGGGDTANGGGGDAYLRMTVDGEAWESDPGMATFTGQHGGVNVLAQRGELDANHGSLIINVGPVDGSGVFELDGSCAPCWAQYTTGTIPSGGTTTWRSTSGSVEITAFDGTHVEGTFAFEGTDEAGGTTKTFAAGEFSTDVMGQ